RGQESRVTGSQRLQARTRCRRRIQILRQTERNTDSQRGEDDRVENRQLSCPGSLLVTYCLKTRKEWTKRARRDNWTESGTLESAHPYGRFPALRLLGRGRGGSRQAWLAHESRARP